MSKKRGQNEGTVHKRKDGRWAATISLGYRGGKRVRKTFYGHTKAEVHEQLVVAQRSVQTGIRVQSASPTLAEFLTKWLEDVVKLRTRPSTYRSYEQICRNHLIPGLGKTNLVKLTPQQIQTFLKDRHERGRCISQCARGSAPRGVSAEHIRRVLRAALGQAEKWDLVPRNVCRLAEAPKRSSQSPKFLDHYQALVFLKHIEGTANDALFSLTLSLGLRLGEVLGLRWSDLDFAGRSVTVQGQFQRLDGQLIRVEPKTARSKRTLPVPDFVLSKLLKHRASQAEIRLVNSDRWVDHDLIFTNLTGNPVDKRNLRRALQAALERAGLPVIRFHDLRHSAASLMLAQGADLRLIMETLGHSQIAITANLYSHVAPKLQREIADRMDRALSPA